MKLFCKLLGVLSLLACCALLFPIAATAHVSVDTEGIHTDTDSIQLAPLSDALPVKSAAFKDRLKPETLLAQCANGRCYASPMQPAPILWYTSQPHMLQPKPDPMFPPHKPAVIVRPWQPIYYRPAPYQYRRTFGVTFHSGRQLNW